MKSFSWLFLFNFLCALVSAAEDLKDPARLYLIEASEANACSWKTSCTPSGAALARTICEKARGYFDSLYDNERRLCKNPRLPACKFVKWRRVCTFVCDPTPWEVQQAIDARSLVLPKTRVKSLSEVIQPVREIGGDRLKEVLERSRRARRLRNLRESINPPQPQEVPQHPLLPDPPHNCVGAVLVFDVSRMGTFKTITKWLHDLREKVALYDGSPVPVVLLANKCDITGASIPTESIRKFCREHAINKWFPTSAKEDVNIDEAMDYLIDRALEVNYQETKCCDTILLQGKSRTSNKCCFR